MELRDHQQLAKDQIIQSIKRGLRRPVVAAPTSFGKTVLAADLMRGTQDKGNRGIFICDRVQLIQQTIEKFSAFGIDFGVIQAGHPMSNPHKPIQIATAQSLQTRCDNGRPLPIFDLAVVDECHIRYKIVERIATEYNKIPLIGLSATPYSRGLGELYNNLLVPIEPRKLLEDGYLCPVKYFVGEHIDLSNVRTGSDRDFMKSDLEKTTISQKDRLTGGIIKNWLEHGENRQTIAFTPSQNHSKYLAETFNKNGIGAEHIDCHVSDKERQEIIAAHNAGEFKILSCTRLLNTGYDAPSVGCLIDCYPSKSETVYVQRAGRLMRTHDHKPYAIYLDHADNFSRFGYAEDIVPAKLCDGTKNRREKELTTQDKKEIKTRECPQCYQAMAGRKCQSCGYEAPITETLETDETMLREVPQGTAANQRDADPIKAEFFSQCTEYAKRKGYKPGWAYMQYKEKYGVAPDCKAHQVKSITIANNWVKHQHIKKANSKRNGRAALDKLMASL